MLRNYFKVALRNISRSASFAFINVAGLAIGMTVCILITLWVQDQLSFDRFHERADQIYRVYHELTMAGSTRRVGSCSAPTGPAMVESISEVPLATTISPAGRSLVQYEQEECFEDDLFFADSLFFQVLTFPLVQGDPTMALTAPHTIVMSESMARRYYGDANPIGRVVRIDGEHSYTVTGVVQDCPTNSHFRFDGLLSMQSQYVDDPQGMARWGRMGFFTYALLADHADPRVVETKLAGLLEENFGERLRSGGVELKFLLQPLRRVYLYSDFQGGIDEGGDIHTVWLFSGIATLVLLIACFNFINLSTARSMCRAREVGMRKTLGASRKRLIGQFLGESVLYGLMAMALACVLVEFTLPAFNELSLRPLSISYSSNPMIIPGLILFAVMVGILAGIYPAFHLSSSSPAQSLKTGFRSIRSRSRFRAALVVIQFSISTILIFGTLSVYQQIEYMKNKRLGFDKERVLVVSNIGNLPDQTRETLKKEISELAGVVSAGISSSVPIAGPFPRMNFLPEGFADDENDLMITVAADAELLNTLGVEIVAGRNFSTDLASDSLNAVLINETAARRFGWDDAVGKTIQRRVFTPDGPVWQTTRVIGVVGDFHLQSLHQEIEPLIIRSDFAPPFNLANAIGVRLSPGNTGDMVDLIQANWARIVPDQGMDYFFLDDSFEAQYRAEERLGRIAIGFSFLAIFVGCLGLFGMISHAAEQRTKEIGIRKVLGASIGSMFGLLSRDFLVIVFIATIIAWPVGFFSMNSWLENFAYRTSIGADIFLISAALALVIALGTICYQVTKASRANPVKALRYE